MESFPTPKIEKITAAAIRVNGEIFTGQMHFMAYEKARLTIPNFEAVQSTMEQGFVTTSGRFVSREEAGELADQAGQLEHLEEVSRAHAVRRLDSHNLEALKKLTEDFDV